MFTVTKALDFDPVDMRFLMVQTAACVLVICEQREPEVAEQKGYFDPVKAKLAEYVNWADHGYTNALQTQVSLLYDFVKMSIDDPSQRYILMAGDRSIITAALQAYQAWKTQLIAAEKVSYEAEASVDSTRFNQRDWSDLNEQFLLTQRD